MEELKIIFFTAYFTANSYLAGHMDSGYDNKIVWWRTLLLIWFAIPYFIYLMIKYSLESIFKKSKWYNDFRFWVLLNFTNHWKGLEVERINTLEIAVLNSKNSYVKNQWLRVKKKYNYENTK